MRCAILHKISLHICILEKMSSHAQKIRWQKKNFTLLSSLFDISIYPIQTLLIIEFTAMSINLYDIININRLITYNHLTIDIINKERQKLWRWRIFLFQDVISHNAKRRFGLHFHLPKIFIMSSTIAFYHMKSWFILK